MESEALQLLQDLGLDPQAAAATVAEIKGYMEQIKEQVKERVVEQALDYFSDKLGIGKRELEPVIVQLASVTVSAGAPRVSASGQVVDADGNVVSS